MLNRFSCAWSSKLNRFKPNSFLWPSDPDDTLDLDDLNQKIQQKLPKYAQPVFLRLIKEVDMTGTYKLIKTRLQKEGYNVDQIQDEIYFKGPKDDNYRLLDVQSYKDIISGFNVAKL